MQSPLFLIGFVYASDLMSPGSSTAKWSRFMTREPGCVQLVRGPGTSGGTQMIVEESRMMTDDELNGCVNRLEQLLTVRWSNELAAELDRIKGDTYVELEEQVAGRNYTSGEAGYPFHALPVSDREVVIEDYVEWDNYKERGLTFEHQARVIYEAARDPLAGDAPPVRDESIYHPEESIRRSSAKAR
jgi:hypothetical protein